MAIPVENNFLYSVRAQASFTWKSMVCELIDNAFDANAKRVSLSWPGGQVFAIEDDGVGTSDLMRLLTLGGRHDHQSNDVGKYGVGCKQALIWLWGVSEITSSTLEGAKSVAVNWGEIACGAMEYPSLEDVVNVERRPPGTTIHCRATRNYPKFDQLLNSISNTYTPGIELGKRIVVRLPKSNPRVLQARQWPKMTKVIDDSVTAAGRVVQIRMGIVDEGEHNPYTNGFSFERTYRVIKESTLGANGFSVSRLAARITLSKEWELSTNKDDFLEYQDELAEAIYERCADLMKEASEQAISFEDSQFNRELAEVVQRSATNRRRESRSSGDTSGSVEPKNTGRRRQNAASSVDEDGSVLDTLGRQSKRRGFCVEPYHADSATFGYYDQDGNRVRLNIANRWLEDKYRLRSQDALIPVIYGILSEHAVRSQSQRNPLFKEQIEGDFCANWGSVVESIALEAVENGK